MRTRLYSLGLIIWLLLLSTIAIAEVPGIHVSTIEDRDHVTIMEFNGNYDAEHLSAWKVREEVAKEFYRTHPDDYDFLVVFTGFDYKLPTLYDGGEAGGIHWSVKNDVMGIGRDIFDNSEFYSSKGKLQGYVDMGPLAEKVTNPMDPGGKMGTLPIFLIRFIWEDHLWQSGR